MQSSSFPASDYFDISSQTKKHFKVCIVCKGYREWTICLFLHICFQVLSLGSCTKWGGSKACQEITKGIQERSTSADVCCRKNVHVEKGGYIQYVALAPSSSSHPKRSLIWTKNCHSQVGRSGSVPFVHYI